MTDQEKQASAKAHQRLQMDRLRDEFAMAALAGRMTGDYPWSELGFKRVAGLSAIENEALLAYQVADAMLAARQEQPK